MALGSIIAGALKGGAEQGIGIADKVMADRSFMERLKEKAKIEMDRIDYQYKLDMEKIGVRFEHDKEIYGTYEGKRTDAKEDLEDKRRYEEGRYEKERGDKLTDDEAAHRRRLEEYDASAAATARHRQPEMEYKEDSNGLWERKKGSGEPWRPSLKEGSATTKSVGTDIDKSKGARGLVENQQKFYKPGEQLKPLGKGKTGSDSSDVKTLKYLMGELGWTEQKATNFVRRAKTKEFDPKKEALKMITEISKGGYTSPEEAEKEVFALFDRLDLWGEDRPGEVTEEPGGPKRIKSREEWEKLKPGERYVDPTGKVRIKS